MILIIFIFLLIELSLVALTDIRYRKIKNSWSLLNLVMGVSSFIFIPQHYPFIFEAFQFSLVFIIVGFLLYLMKIMGGGDSKFLATFFLVIPYNLQENFFYYLLIGTIIVGLVFFLKSVIQNRVLLFRSFVVGDIQGVKNCFGTKFAYAPVILMAWVFLGLEHFFL